MVCNKYSVVMIHNSNIKNEVLKIAGNIETESATIPVV